MTFSKQRFGLFVEYLLPLLVLLFLGYYTFASFFIRPYVGYETSDNKTVTNVINQIKTQDGLKQGDTILRIGKVTNADVAANLHTAYFEGLQAGDQAEIVVNRQGQQKTIQYTLPGITAEDLLNRLNSQWMMPYIFWLAGTAALFFLRPRHQQRLLLVLFCYLTAGWLSASNLSGYHTINGALVLRSLIWLSLPVYLHLHWVFPTPLRRLPGWTWGLLYTFSALMAVVSWMQWVPQNTYFIGFILAVVGSLVLLGVHLLTQPAERRPLAGLAIALGMVLLPVLVIGVLGLLKINYPFPGIVVLGLAALPGFYFFTLYRRQLSESKNRQADRLVRTYVGVILAGLLFCVGFAFISQTQMVYQYLYNLNLLAMVILAVIAVVNFIPFLVLPALANEEISLGLGSGLRFSANRAAAGAVFLMIEILFAVLLVFATHQFTFPGSTELGLVLAVLASGIAALLLYPSFKRFFERNVLGMTFSPETLAKNYSGRITTSLEAASLQKLLLEEVFPSLLVRQAAQVFVREGILTLDFSLRVSRDMLPTIIQAGRLGAMCNRVLDPETSPLPAWVRLVLPLQINNETGGFWLLGQRDPDDRYNTDDIATLQTLADQTALALVNIQQADNLRALYFADIDRNEQERTHLAAELHDDVLSQMAVLSQNLQDSTPAALGAYDQAVTHIRQIITGLRPAMLNFGLHSALETLADELSDRLPEGPQIKMDVPASSMRYDSRLELYLFRIVQQACNNAIRHARCQTIRIGGSLTDGAVELLVIDDGEGFAGCGQIDLPTLLAGKHFGLAGMFERAALVEAQLGIQSQPGQGCQVSVRWAG